MRQVKTWTIPTLDSGPPMLKLGALAVDEVRIVVIAAVWENVVHMLYICYKSGALWSVVPVVVLITMLLVVGRTFIPVLRGL